MVLFGPRPFEATPVYTWIGLSLVVLHLVVNLPEMIADLRSSITDERHPVAAFVSDTLAARPRPETVERYPWTIWAWKFSLFTVCAAVVGFSVAWVVHAVAF